MFVIKECRLNPPRKLIEMLKAVEPATVGHFKHYGFIDPSNRQVPEKISIIVIFFLLSYFNRSKA